MKNRVTIYQETKNNIKFYEFGSLKLIYQSIYADLVKKLQRKNLFFLIYKPRRKTKGYISTINNEYYNDKKLYLVHAGSNNIIDELFELLICDWDYYIIISEEEKLISLSEKVFAYFNPKKRKFVSKIFEYIDTIGHLGHDDLAIEIYTKKYELEYLKQLLKGIINKEFEFRESEKQLFGEGLLVE